MILSIKLINGFAYNLAQQFGASCEHICFLLNEGNIQEFQADLITGDILPLQLAIPRNKNLVEMIQYS